MRNTMPLLVLVSLLTLLTGCGGGGGDSSLRPDDSQPIVQAADSGTPTDTAVSAVIDAMGGELKSSDGRITMTVPAGAVANATTFTIQPITNTAQGGAGAAYRLGPEGTTFGVPVQLTFHYGPSDISGTAPELLGVAYQDSDGYWHALKQATVDAHSGTVTVTTTHLSDWSLLWHYTLLPHAPTVLLNGHVGLVLHYCALVEEGALTSLVAQCAPDTSDRLTNWTVNGVQGGSSQSGTVTVQGAGSAMYSAPALLPPTNPVSVSAELEFLVAPLVPNLPGKVLLTSNVTVIGPPAYFKGEVTATRDTDSGVTTTWQGGVTYQLSYSSPESAGYQLVSATGTIVKSGTDDGGCVYNGSASTPVSHSGSITLYSDGTYSGSAGYIAKGSLTITCGPDVWPYPDSEMSSGATFGASTGSAPVMTDGVLQGSYSGFDATSEWNLVPSATP